MSFGLLDLSSLSLLLSPHHPHSTIFHYHLIFIFLYFHHYLFHSSFSLLGVMILRIFWYIEDSHITLFFIPSFDIDSEILA